MWKLLAPSNEQIARFREAQTSLPFSYESVGASCEPERIPAGYDVDHNRVPIGRGEAVFAAACDVLRQWRQFPAPWTAIHPAETPLAVGNTVVMLARVYGLWWLNACRIVRTFAEERRFGFVYGTLPGHVEQGEERFLIERDDEDVVWYDIRAFSRPRYWVCRWTYPLVRRQQRRFVRESQAVVRRFVSEVR